jgi:uncharacterized membrane protein
MSKSRQMDIAPDQFLNQCGLSNFGCPGHESSFPAHAPAARRQPNGNPGSNTTQEDNPVIKAFRIVTVCSLSVAFASSIAWAQTYKQVDVPDSTAVFTELTGGPNLEGTSVGAWGDAAGALHGFSLTAKGVFTPVVPPGSTFTTPNFINFQGVIVGAYLDSATPIPVSHGFILVGEKYNVVDVPGAAGTAFTGINDLGEISGNTCSDPACGNTGNANTTHSFVRSTKGVFTFFDPPGATSSAANTVSLLGAVVGVFTDTTGELNHGYLLQLGRFTTIDFPGATTGTFAGGGNLENDIVGIYNFVNCTTDCNHGFLRHNGVFTSFDFPGGAIFTDATGINALGVIVGVFTDSSGNSHGFIRTP